MAVVRLTNVRIQIAVRKQEYAEQNGVWTFAINVLDVKPFVQNMRSRSARDWYMRLTVVMAVPKPEAVTTARNFTELTSHRMNSGIICPKPEKASIFERQKQIG